LTQTVSIPVWLFAILLLLALWAATVLLLAPGMRWFFRRRVNLVIHEINSRLNIDFPSFKVTRRQVLIDRLFHDPKVQAAVDAQCVEQNLKRGEVMRKVDRYAREIVPSFNAYVYFRIGYRIARAVARSMYRVRVGFADEPGMRRISPKSTIVFVMNHRSNMDYVLVAFLAAEQAALSYAVGEWARVWPLQQLIRSMGAYFVRRNSGDPLYRLVLQRYVQMATEAGVCQAVFPEGGLTIDGKLRAPKLGLLDYMLKNFNPGAERDLVFIPVGINYDRVLEDRSQLRKLDRAAPRRSVGFALAVSAAFNAKNLWLAVTGRWYRFGYACVNFGSPLSMREYLRGTGEDLAQLPDAERHAAVSRVGEVLMRRIGEVIPALPVAVVANVMERSAAEGDGSGLSELELKSRALELMNALEHRGARVYIPRQDQDYAIGVGLRMLTLRRLVIEQEGLFAPAPENRAVLAYYANSICHLTGDTAAPAPEPAPGGKAGVQAATPAFAAGRA